LISQPAALRHPEIHELPIVPESHDDAAERLLSGFNAEKVLNLEDNVGKRDGSNRIAAMKSELSAVVLPHGISANEQKV
jgi:hypothetical protein